MEIEVSEWISYKKSDGKKESIGGLGGFFDYGMRWGDYLDAIPELERPYAEAIRRSVLKNELKFNGSEHQYSEVGMPLFTDDTVGSFSMRAWGDLMVAIWSEEEKKDYCYMDFYC